MALFKSNTIQIIKNSALLGLTNLPIIGMVIIIHLLILLIADYSAKARVMVISLLLFFGFAGLAYFFSIFYKRIFDKILGVDDKESESEDTETEDTEEYENNDISE